MPSQISDDEKQSLLDDSSVECLKVQVKDGSLTTKRISRNLLLCSVVFLLQFTAYTGLTNLQSSIFITGGLGVITQSIIFGTQAAAAFIIPKLFISKLGYKKTIVISLISYIFWMAANGYGIWATMVPTSIIVGIFSASLWTAQLSYFAIMSSEYSRLKGEESQNAMGAFFGIFYGTFRLSGFFGSILSAAILSPKQENFTKPTQEEIQLCGMHDCPDDNKTNVNYEAPPEHLIWTLVGSYISITVVGIIVYSLFVDPLPNYLLERNRTSTNLLTTIPYQLSQVKQLLLLIFTIYVGFEQAFLAADYYKSWVTCNLGVWYVGLVALPNALVNTLTCLVSGRLVKYVGRIPIFITGFILEFGIHMTLIFWNHDPNNVFIFYLVPGIWGVTDAIWQTQVSSLIGALFPSNTEAAFAVHRLCVSLGFSINYGYSASLCTSVKVYILVGFLLVGMLGYLLVEWKDHKDNKYIKLKQNATN